MVRPEILISDGYLALVDGPGYIFSSGIVHNLPPLLDSVVIIDGVGPASVVERVGSNSFNDERIFFTSNI